MGFRYFLFRSWYEIMRKSGILQKRFPTDPPIRKFIALNEWRKLPVNFFFQSKADLAFSPDPQRTLEKKARQILEGKVEFFSSITYNLGLDYDWVTNPDTHYRYDVGRHWTTVADFSKEAGDIKYVWEKSRFSYLYTLFRYDYHFDQDCSDFVFEEIDSWIEANPINQGPNYKCSQEISLRIMNWLFCLYFYRDSEQLTEERFQRIIHAIYWQLKHVYQNINFSRIAVRNNHAITETLMLYLGGLFFPFFPESRIWKKKGKNWFEQEIAYQIYEDGTFLQFSHNYHRVVVQLLSWALYLSRANQEKFKQVVYERARMTLRYLAGVLMTPDGHLPNYGANDGALFFKLNNATYRDYRPQFNALYFYLNKKVKYPEYTEDICWYSGSENGLENCFSALQNEPLQEFVKGGIYVIRENSSSLTFIKCTGYKDRPSHADNLHLDIWVSGKNILRDMGSYRYNADPDLVAYFNGTSAHNTVTLGEFDQMEKGPRFIWMNWSRAISSELEEREYYFRFEGKITAFPQVGKKVFHHREVKKYKGTLKWEIADHLYHDTALPMKQWWNICDDFYDAFDIKAIDEEGNSIVPRIRKGFYSDLYGVKKESKAVLFETNSKRILTTIQAI